MYSRLLATLALVFGLKARFAFADKSKGAGGTGDDSGAGGSDDGNDDTGGAGDGGKKSVSYDTYDKTMKELKALKRANKEMSDKQTNSENDRLQAEGKKDELITKLRGDLDKATKNSKDLVGNFVNASLANQVREIAASMGCVDVDAIDKLVDLSDVEVDTKTFRAEKDALTELLNGLKKSKPYLFNKAAPKINTKLPGGGRTFETESGKKALKEMSKDEIFGELRKLNGR